MVTADMSRNMQEAANGVEMIIRAMDEVSELTQKADRAVQTVGEAIQHAA